MSEIISLTELKKMRVKQLRDELQKRDLETTGLKGDLVFRLDDYMKKQKEASTTKNDEEEVQSKTEPVSRKRASASGEEPPNKRSKGLPEMNMSLDDIIKKEHKERTPRVKPETTSNSFTAPQADYTAMSVEEIREHLSTRGLSLNGDRNALVARLKAEVQRAWNQFYNQKAPGVKAKNKPRKKKKKLTDEEKAAIAAEHEKNRQAKLKRKAANIRIMEEAREAKRLKKEMIAEKQKKLHVEQKQQKELRQKCETFVKFDMKEYERKIKTTLDPVGEKISSVNYDMSQKGFRIKYRNEECVLEATKNSTVSSPHTFSLTTEHQMIAAPLESQCVFFLYPLEEYHPNREAAIKWVESQGAEFKANDLKTLKMWVDSALKVFQSYGKIINVYRDRGFMVVYFAKKRSAEAMLKAGSKKFNGVPMVFLQSGTPTKKHKQECLLLLDPK